MDSLLYGYCIVFEDDAKFLSVKLNRFYHILPVQLRQNECLTLEEFVARVQLPVTNGYATVEIGISGSMGDAGDDVNLSYPQEAMGLFV